MLDTIQMMEYYTSIWNWLPDVEMLDELLQ